MEGTYNFSSNGCTPCECDSVGSVSGNCSDEGQCQCKVHTRVHMDTCTHVYTCMHHLHSTTHPFVHPNFSPSPFLPPFLPPSLPPSSLPYLPPLTLSPSFSPSQPGVTGLKCSECLPGFYFLSNSGCLPCNCSSRTANCQQDPTSPSLPSELCTCPLPYTGNSCESCVSGFFLSDATGNCEPCECNGRALSCTPGSGICLVSYTLLCIYCNHRMNPSSLYETDIPQTSPSRTVPITLWVSAVNCVGRVSLTPVLPSASHAPAILSLL